MFWPLLDVHNSFCVAGAMDAALLQVWGFSNIFKNNDKRGAFEEHLHRCISRGRRSARDISVRYVSRSGSRFPEKGCILKHQIVCFGKMILHDRCSSSYDLASLFRGRRGTFERSDGQIAKRNGTMPSALHSTLSFLKEVSQNCFVFELVNFTKWGSLAEFRPIWCCEVLKLRKSRRKALFFSFQVANCKEVSQLAE